MQATEGIILRVTPFQEGSMIVTLFSKDFGIITSIKKERKNVGSAVSALMKVALTVLPSEKDIWRSSDWTILTAYPKLRAALSPLRTAASMLNITLAHTAVRHPSAAIYDLLNDHLHALALCIDPKTCGISFFLKLLSMEGVLQRDASLSDFIDKNILELVDTPSEEGLFQKITSEWLNAKGGT